MEIVKLLSFILLGVYLTVVGLEGVGISLGFIPPFVVAFFALASGVFFLIWGIKEWCGCCSCEKS